MSRGRIPLDVVDDQNTSLYVSERKIYPRDVSGRLTRLRVAAVWWLLGMFYVFPWLRWDGRQAVLFDLPARKFHIFWLTFWPQDFLFLALLLIIAAMTLFFFTALAGRLWCGYACPQTVWTEAFLWMERICEGDRPQRMKLDAGPWNRNKLLRKGSKHLLWLTFALWTGFTFVGFFTPILDLSARFYPFAWGGWETFWVLFYALATWGNAGFLREQVCKYMCPYARFQSAMFDRNTLIIAYDPMRGEPRGPRKRGLASVLERARGLLDKDTAFEFVLRSNLNPSAADQRALSRGTIDLGSSNQPEQLVPLPKPATDSLGDCIDCTICVQVCPTGIDIRNGLQYECIACGACIDACNDVMDKMGYPHGLIRYSNQNVIDGKKSQLLRPRIIVYGLLLLTLIVGWVWGVNSRSTLIVDVLRDRNALYQQAQDNRIDNMYTLKLINKDERQREYRISIQSDIPGIEIRGGMQTVQADAEEVLALPIVLSAPANVSGRQPVHFIIESVDGQDKQVIDSSFFGPM